MECKRTGIFSALHDLIARFSLCCCSRHSHSCPACHQDAIKAPPHRLLTARSFPSPHHPSVHLYFGQGNRSGSLCCSVRRCRRCCHWIGRYSPSGGRAILLKSTLTLNFHHYKLRKDHQCKMPSAQLKSWMQPGTHPYIHAQISTVFRRINSGKI